MFQVMNFFTIYKLKELLNYLKYFLRNQKNGILSKDLIGFKIKEKDIFNLKYFYENIICKILGRNKEKMYYNHELNNKLNDYFNFVYLQIRKKLSSLNIIIVLRDDMSNQFDNGFQGSQPFITDKQFQNLSLDEIRHLIEQEKEELKKDYKELASRRKLINKYKKLVAARQQVKSGIDIRKNLKKKASTKIRNTSKKIKTFEEYFEECIKNKKIPKDTPEYLRKALERAIREYDQGIVKEKSSIGGFANKYTIEGIFGLNPIDFFVHINETLVDFFTYHRNIKFKLVLVCMMEKHEVDKKNGIFNIKEDKAYFNSPTFINLESNDVDDLIFNSRESILGQMEAYTEKGSNWVFKEVVKFEIHTVEYNPNKGSSYIDLPKWIKDKKAIINIKNKDDKCFIWCILRYLYPRDRDEERINDLKKYEFSLNTKGITFPMKVNNITQFEKLNPELPGINVFSKDDKMIIYNLREAKRDCKNTIDLFLIQEDGVSHYTLIKNFHRLIRSQKNGSNNGKLFICKRCFSYFTKEELLDKHIEYCSNNATAVLKMPEKKYLFTFQKLL